MNVITRHFRRTSHRCITATVLFSMLAIVIALGTTGCTTKTDPSSNPFKPCPQGLSRIKDVTYQPPDWWVCEG